MGVRDLEVMMQNTIITAFKTVTTVEAGVELLEVFAHLSSREVQNMSCCLFAGEHVRHHINHQFAEHNCL